MKQILIVNNSLVVRKLIERAFRSLGYKVDTAENIEKAESIMGTSPADIIITDVKLADGSGIDFYHNERASRKTPFIFLADDSMKSELESQIQGLEKAELTKTHEVSEIVKLVENMI